MYAGANGKLKSLGDLSEKKRYAIQPKIDGAYGELYIGATGRVEKIIGRSGKALECVQARSLINVFGGRPGSIYCGELETHTEAGLKAARDRGFAKFHIFDAKKIGNKRIGDLPQWRRRDLLFQHWTAAAIAAGADAPCSDDSNGRAHDDLGRFAKRRPFAWRRLPIVPEYRADIAGVYGSLIRDGFEGGVIIDRDATLGRRRSKLKLKPIDSLDCEVVETGTKKCVLIYHAEAWAREMISAGMNVIGSEVVHFVTSPLNYSLSIGDIVSVAHNGHYESGVPRFPRIIGVRGDLA